MKVFLLKIKKLSNTFDNFYLIGFEKNFIMQGMSTNDLNNKGFESDIEGAKHIRLI